jgi:glycerophosphoryl diester phosphodiesterase
MQEKTSGCDTMVLNIAHRGARSLAPENTLLAARKAFDIGADLWETDLAVSRDGHLFLLHDALLLRTTDVAERFPQRCHLAYTHFDLKEIRSLDAGSWFTRTDPFGQIAESAVAEADLRAYRGLTVPTLEEALVFTRDSGWRMNLELKRLPAPLTAFPVVERVLALLDRIGMAAGQVILSSFEHGYLRQSQALRPQLAVAALIGDRENDPLKWGDLAFATYNVRSSLLDDAQIRWIRGQGKKINLFTVNRTDDMQRFMAAGVDGIITDFPQRLKALQPAGQN